jgi:hypothetical protein
LSSDVRLPVDDELGGVALPTEMWQLLGNRRLDGKQAQEADQ